MNPHQRVLMSNNLMSFPPSQNGVACGVLFLKDLGFFLLCYVYVSVGVHGGQ